MEEGINRSSATAPAPNTVTFEDPLAALLQLATNRLNVDPILMI